MCNRSESLLQRVAVAIPLWVHGPNMARQEDPSIPANNWNVRGASPTPSGGHLPADILPSGETWSQLLRQSCVVAGWSMDLSSSKERQKFRPTLLANFRFAIQSRAYFFQRNPGSNAKRHPDQMRHVLHGASSVPDCWFQMHLVE